MKNALQLICARKPKEVEDPDLIARLHDENYCARPERAVVITLEGFDWNCPQHLLMRLTVEELQPILAPLQEGLAQLRAENAALKAGGVPM